MTSCLGAKGGNLTDLISLGRSLKVTLRHDILTLNGLKNMKGNCALKRFKWGLQCLNVHFTN